MNEEFFRNRHHSLNAVISGAIAHCNEDRRWDQLRTLLARGGGIGHYVAAVEGDVITFHICIYPFPPGPALPQLWGNTECRRYLDLPRPIKRRVMQQFTGFTGGDTFYHRTIPAPLDKMERGSIEAKILACQGAGDSLFDSLDRGDLALLPDGTSCLFICPLRVLASPSTFLFFQGEKQLQQHQVSLAELLACHFDVALLTSAMDGLLRAITKDVENGSILTLTNLQQHFVDDLASVFLPRTIVYPGGRRATAVDLVANESKHALRVELSRPSDLLILTPPSVPATGGKARTLCDQDGMQDKYACLSKLLTSLYHQLETTFDAVIRTQSHNILNLVRHPLTRVNDAIAALQSHAQELRATLYEPDEVLLRSPEVVAPHFQEDNPLPTLKLEGHHILLRHDPSDYKGQPGEPSKYIVASLFCSILGRARPLCEASSLGDFLDRAKTAITEAKAQPATRRLVTSLEQFFGISDLSLFAQLREDQLINCLADAKATFFTAFKPEGKWPKGAVLFLLRSEEFDGVAVEGELKDSDKVKLLANMPWSPLTYSSLLRFLKDIVTAWKGDPRNPIGRLCSITWTETAGEAGSATCELILHFSSNVLPTSEISRLRARLKETLNLEPEWRLEAITHGDVTRAFIMLGNRLLRFGGRRAEWTNKPRSRDHEVLMLRHRGNRLRFAVGVQNEVLKLSWNKS